MSLTKFILIACIFFPSIGFSGYLDCYKDLCKNDIVYVPSKYPDPVKVVSIVDKSIGNNNSQIFVSYKLESGHYETTNVHFVYKKTTQKCAVGICVGNLVNRPKSWLLDKREVVGFYRGLNGYDYYVEVKNHNRATTNSILPASLWYPELNKDCIDKLCKGNKVAMVSLSGEVEKPPSKVLKFYGKGSDLYILAQIGTSPRMGHFSTIYQHIEGNCVGDICLGSKVSLFGANFKGYVEGIYEKNGNYFVEAKHIYDVRKVHFRHISEFWVNKK